MLSCTECNSPVSKEMINTHSLAACSSCNSLLRIDVFPAFYRSPPIGQSGETLQVDKEAGCFYHPRKKAVVPCAACGRFLCALCDVAFNDQHVCPACLEKGRTQRKIKNLENHRTCYDTIALALALVVLFPPFIFIFWITFFTAPLVIFLTVRYWKAPSSIIPRTRIRFILAFVIAVMEIIALIFFFLNLVSLK